ncbi:hypothetical protein HYW59_02315 [Candidatus Kaiserbacteria bacterium]|nr:hypothetical protein [Candidatus Kaiserbacteria bacterium]MBI2612624.1 hypothetical protein [Candidatus Kaiserbacteria bacterium]
MVDYHIVLGVVSVILALVGYATYFRSIFKGETKPHAFTWIAFTLIDGTIFFIQLAEGGGPGSWVLGVAAFFAAFVSVLALSRGERDVRAIDWACLAGAVLGLVLWLGTESPLGAVLVLTVTNLFAVAPTFRKSFVKPDEESMVIWALDVVKFSMSVFALESRTLTTALFPASIAISNGALVVMVLLRRQKLGRLSR